MKYIFLGDVSGKPGRIIIEKLLPKYIEKYQPDFIIANSENLSHGKSANPKHLDEMQEIGIDYFTGGNHTFSTKEALKEFENGSKRQLRPLNYPEGTIGDGYFIIENKILLISILGNIFMQTQLENPILCIEKLFEKIKKEKGENYFNNLEIFIDIHTETGSEKKGLAYNFDGIATGVFGTHTHIQTNDAQILEKGTGYITDLGMNGAMESVIGVKKEIIINRMKTQIGEKFKREESGKLELSGIFFESENGKCKKIELIRDFI